MKKILLTIIIAISISGFASAQSNNDIADSLYNSKKYSEALQYYENVLSETSEDKYKIETIKKIIGCYGFDGLSNYDKCIEYDKQALELAKKVYGETSSQYGTMLWYLCFHNYCLDNYSESIEYGIKALNIYSISKWQKMRCCEIVGLSHYWQNQNRAAVYYFTRYSQYAIELYGEQSTNNANSLRLLGCTYHYMSNYARSIDYLNQAASIYLSEEGEQSGMYNQCLSKIADAYTFSRNKDKSIEYALKCYNLNKKYGNDSTYTSVSAIESLGHAYHFAGNEDTAIKYYEEALRQYMKIYNKENSSDYIYLGRAYRGKGDLDKSLEHLLKADELYKANSDKPNTFLLYNLAKMYFDRGEFEKSYSNIKECCDIHTINLYDEFSYMTSDSKAGRWNNISEDYDALLEASIEVNTQEARTEAYNSLLLSKGILLSTEQQLQDVVANSNNERLSNTFVRLKDAKDKISKESDKGNTRAVDSLKKVADEYETEIMSQSNLFGDIVKNLKINTNDIKAHLGKNDVAIEFFFTEHGKFGALVMKRDFKHPELIMLKDSTYEGIMKDGKLNKNSAYHGLGLYNNIWKPLEKYFNKNGNVYFSPSGKLHTLAIEYAPISDSLLISNKYRIHRVSSTRYLALNSSHEMSKRAVIYGGIKYDTDINNMLTQSKGYSHSLSELLVSRQYLPMGGNFSANYLPGTLREANAIDSILYGKKFTTKLVTGSEANEESFKNLSGVNYDILHIATHGYCEQNSSLHGDNALELSGLLFSGCNNASKVSSEIEDGVLSAKEISLLDFRNVDMVVMSACETGLGEISNEGVFGLQRGFKKAGANTIVMSLWPVSDKATMIWMTKFYENLASGMKKQEAFSKAQQELRKQFRHPAFWAAFIMLDGE